MNRPIAVVFTAVVAAAAALQPLRAGAELPMPTYPQCGEPDRPDLCPDDADEWWMLLSYVPDDYIDNVRPEEHDLGTGNWVDRAWRITTGRPDVVIAVLDSGAMWDFDNVLRKHYLHAPELPVPQDAAGVDAADHDANGDGVFNIDDYADDPRVAMDAGVDAADDVLDPSDLIATFSDGVDDDGNGFVDDISGWDFFWNDNDPYDDVRFDHGAWEAELALAEGNDGDGDIGACPNCMLLNVRVGDSFVCDTTNFANGLLYAVDMGVDVVIEALGTINNTQATIDAIEYAYAHDVTIMGSAADEASFHHNYPANNHHTIYTHAIIHDDEDEEASTTFLNFANCTNFGGRLELSVGAFGCSSGSVGFGGGIAGLLYSRARDIDLDPPLSANEVRQILVMTVDDVDVPESWSDPEKYPSKEGWDPHFGYGRVNAYRAVQMVDPDTIPPEVDLLTPTWFQTIDPETSGAIPVTGTVDARRAASYSWSLQVAPGIHPDEEDFVEIAAGQGSGGTPTEGELGTIDPAAIPMDPSAPFEPYTLDHDDWSLYSEVNRWTVTLRLVAEDDAGNRAHTRKVLYLHRDPDLLPGFPVRTVASLESSPVLVDVDGDARDELFYVTADGMATLADLAAEGGIEPRDGWPQMLALLDEADPTHPDNHLEQPAWSSGSVSSDVHHSVMGTPAIGDIDADGTLEFVIATLEGQIQVFEVDGSVQEGFPVFLPLETVAFTEPGYELDYGSFAAPVLADLDGDDHLEIIVAAMDQQLYVIRSDGSTQPGFPVLLRHVNQSGESEGTRIITTPAVGDIDGDGELDIIAATNEEPGSTTRYSVAYAVRADGTLFDGWPIYARGAFNGDLLPYVGEGAPSCPALADVDGDGSLELAFYSIGDTGNLYALPSGEVYLQMANLADDFGSGSNSIEEAFAAVTINSPSFGDLDGDGVLDVAMGSAGWAFAEGVMDGGRRHDHDHLLSAWSGADGSFLRGFPQVMEDMQFFMNPAIADIDGDGRAEVINGSGGFMLHAFDADGGEPDGWPKFTGQWLLGSPALGDADGDGYLDVVMGSRNGWLYAWRTVVPACEADIQWANMHHDLRNTRNYHTELPAYPPVAADDPDGGCGCSADGRGRGGAAALLLVGAATLARRRRRV